MRTLSNFQFAKKEWLAFGDLDAAKTLLTPCTQQQRIIVKKYNLDHTTSSIKQ